MDRSCFNLQGVVLHQQSSQLQGSFQLLQHQQPITQLPQQSEGDGNSLLQIQGNICSLSQLQVYGDSATISSPALLQHTTIPSQLATKIDLPPKFDGNCVKEWIYKYEQFFTIANIPEYDKVKFASSSLEGKALIWHRTLEYSKSLKEQHLCSWDAYSKAITNRFGFMDNIITYKNGNCDEVENEHPLKETINDYEDDKFIEVKVSQEDNPHVFQKDPELKEEMEEKSNSIIVGCGDDEVFDPMKAKEVISQDTSQILNIIMLDSDQMHWLRNKSPHLSIKEGFLIFEYEKITIKEIKGQLIQKGFKISVIQCDNNQDSTHAVLQMSLNQGSRDYAWKQFNGVVQFMSRWMPIAVGLFVEASDFSFERSSNLTEILKDSPRIIHMLLEWANALEIQNHVVSGKRKEIFQHAQEDNFSQFSSTNELQNLTQVRGEITATFSLELKGYKFYLGPSLLYGFQSGDLPVKPSAQVLVALDLTEFFNSFESHAGLDAIQNKFLYTVPPISDTAMALAPISIRKMVYKILGKITFVIWNWFYKDCLEELEMMHPGRWNLEWKIAWELQIKIC